MARTTPKLLSETLAEIEMANTPFMVPMRHYECFQENGTKYLKLTLSLPDRFMRRLDSCEGEIFLASIPPHVTAENIAHVAAQLGVIYMLRFKVNFAGKSRGFAYLQYVEPELLQLAKSRLPIMFREQLNATIRVHKSRNVSELLLKRTYRLSPLDMYVVLKEIIEFKTLVCREMSAGYYEYQVVFRCNEAAVHARRDLLKNITRLGCNAIIVWDNTRISSLMPRSRGVNQPISTFEIPFHIVQTNFPMPNCIPTGYNGTPLTPFLMGYPKKYKKGKGGYVQLGLNRQHKSD